MNDRAAFRIFERAMDVDPPGRDAFLEETCGSDERLRSAVEAMLAAAESPDAQLEHGIGRSIKAVFEKNPARAQIGDRIGPYRLERLLGRGGMGEVFLAQREDGVAMKAAVKLALGGWDDRPLARRFQRERDILASLKHPNIAKLYDAGTTPDHRSFFIMEYVEGKPIDEYCHLRQLSLTQRLKLFAKVCNAVSYAHQNLVIHRDIKPANILVTREGEPKLLDFGVSSLMMPGKISSQTQTLMGLTPGFASPEQLDHQRLTAASDVYSLGVLLYLLLTGRLPVPMDGISPMEFFRKLREEDIPKPSDLVSRRPTASGSPQTPAIPGLGRQLKGDLDAIMMTALAKEPERRYSSVEAFSSEIHRFLQGLPVHARSPTIFYRTGKFLARNKWPFAMFGLGIIMLASFSIAMYYQKRQTEKQRDTSQQVVTFLAQTFQGADPNNALGETVSAEALLDRGAVHIDAQLEDQPEVQAHLMTIMGIAYRNLGEFEKAEPLLKKALSLNRQLKGAGHADTIQNLGALGNLYKDLSKFELAEPLFQQAVDHHREEGTPEGLAFALNELGLVLSEQGRKMEAEALFREAYHSRDQISERQNAATANNLGLLLKGLGKYAEAEPLLSRALDFHKRNYSNPHPTIATSLNNLGLLAKEQGDLVAAESYWKASLAMRRQLYKPDHPKIMTALNNLAAVFKDKGDLAAAEPLFREVLMLRRQRYGPGHPRLMISLNNLASLLLDKGDFSETEELLNEAMGIAQRRLKPTHILHGILARNRALLRLEQGRSEEGYALAVAAVESLRQEQEPGSLHLVLAEGILGGALLAEARYEEAEPLLVNNYRYLVEADRQFPTHSERLRQWLIQLFERTQRPKLAANYQSQDTHN